MHNSGYARHSITNNRRGAEAETSAVATAAAGSCTTVGTLATAIPTTLRGAEAEASAVATAAAGSCTTVGTLATAVLKTLRGAEAEASAVATAAAGSCTAVATLAPAAAASLLQLLGVGGDQRSEPRARVEGGEVSSAENVLPIGPSILFSSGTGSPEQSSVGTAALPSAGKVISVRPELYV